MKLTARYAKEELLFIAINRMLYGIRLTHKCGRNRKFLASDMKWVQVNNKYYFGSNTRRCRSSVARALSLSLANLDETTLLPTRQVFQLARLSTKLKDYINTWMVFTLVWPINISVRWVYKFSIWANGISTRLISIIQKLSGDCNTRKSVTLCMFGLDPTKCVVLKSVLLHQLKMWLVKMSVKF